MEKKILLHRIFKKQFKVNNYNKVTYSNHLQQTIAKLFKDNSSNNSNNN